MHTLVADTYSVAKAIVTQQYGWTPTAPIGFFKDTKGELVKFVASNNPSRHIVFHTKFYLCECNEAYGPVASYCQWLRNQALYGRIELINL